MLGKKVTSGRLFYGVTPISQTTLQLKIINIPAHILFLNFPQNPKDTPFETFCIIGYGQQPGDEHFPYLVL